MQVSARVVPATAAWTGVRESSAAIQQLTQPGGGRVLVRRTGVVETRGAILHAGDRDLLVVTVQYPRN